MRQVCRQFLRGSCNRKEEECRYAHPPKNVSVSPDNLVTACIDFIKGRCSHDPCRYFHPPDHLKARVYIPMGGVCTGTGCRCCRHNTTIFGVLVLLAGHLDEHPACTKYCSQQYLNFLLGFFGEPPADIHKLGKWSTFSVVVCACDKLSGLILGFD